MGNLEPARPTTIPQPLSGMIDPEIDLASIRDPWEQRVMAISLVAAMQATTEPGPLSAWRPDSSQQSPRLLITPEAFRISYLPGGMMLTPHAVDSWVRHQALVEGEPSWWPTRAYIHPEEIESYVDDGIKLAEGAILHIEPAIGWTRRLDNGQPVHPMQRAYVEYITPTSPGERHAVRGGGALDTLRLIAEYLDRWEWSAAQGATFVLTGLVPYSAAFAEHVAVRHGRRPRPMSLKHLSLAVFTERVRQRGEGLPERLAHWNVAYPEWAYTNIDQFSSDSGRAWRRMR